MAYAKKTSKANEAFQKLKNDLAAGTDGNVFSTRIDQELETLKETARKSQDNVRLVDLL